MKLSSIIGSVALFLICIILMVAGMFWHWPQATAEATGFGPYNTTGIALCCAWLVIVVGSIGWVLERMFERAGKAGLHVHWHKNQPTHDPEKIPEFSADKDGTQWAATLLTEHLRRCYGRRWKHKVRILLVQGQDADLDHAVPGLTRDQWQEGDGIVLIRAGDAQSPPDQAWLSALKQVRPRRPLDGIVHVLNTDSLPLAVQCDAWRRCRQKADQLLGWQAPVWLWLIDKAYGPAAEKAPSATGALFGPGATAQDAMSSLDELVPRLRQAGIAQVLNDPDDDWLLRLSSRLHSELKTRLMVLFNGLMQGTAPYRLRGVILSPELSDANTAAHVRLNGPAWQAVAKDSQHTHAKSIAFDGLQASRLFLLVVVVVWGAGTLLSLAINRTEIYQAQDTARLAGDTQQPLPQRLRNQLVLQQTLARLQHRTDQGAPWFTRFGLNQDRDTLAVLWPQYARNNIRLMRDATAAHLQQQLHAYVQLPPASHARTQGTQRAYTLLKSYLMLARPDKTDAVWLSKQVMASWPTRKGVPDGMWQSLAPKLLGFYAQSLPTHPEWKIIPDAELISSVRQILLKQIGQRNAEAGLYQEMLKRIASNWPDLTLAEMTGDTDASTLFSTDDVVPGMFTRQAWQDQVQNAIAEVVKTRRDEIDWVLTDKTRQPDSEISPEALKTRLTERYFTDFGNAWLNMVNSIQWHGASSLSEAIAQLNLLADVRQSPLVALMNTLAWQGKTGQKGEGLADSIVDSAKKLLGQEKHAQHFAQLAQGPRGPLDGVFGPLLGVMEGKDGTRHNGNLSFQSWLARVTQVRLKLQQVTSAPDPQAMAQMLAQTVFQGKTIDLTDTRDYGSLMAASLGQEWSGFGQALFVQPLDLAWRRVLVPAAGSLNAHWQSTVVAQWDHAFAGRYPFNATGSDAALPLLAQFLRSDSGRITTFLKTHLGGILHQEGNRWVVDPAASQGMTVNPEFLNAINQLAGLSDIVFTQGDAKVQFELMARPSRDIARMQLTVDEQHLDYFNQMESWQSFIWPGNTYYPGVQLSWRSVNTGMRLHAGHQGNWGLIRLLDQARVTPLDSGRTQLEWRTPEGNALTFILRSELGDGPFALLALQGFRLPEFIFKVEPRAENRQQPTPRRG